MSMSEKTSKTNAYDDAPKAVQLAADLAVITTNKAAMDPKVYATGLKLFGDKPVVHTLWGMFSLSMDKALGGENGAILRKTALATFHEKALIAELHRDASAADDDAALTDDVLQNYFGASDTNLQAEREVLYAWGLATAVAYDQKFISKATLLATGALLEILTIAYNRANAAGRV